MRSRHRLLASATTALLATATVLLAACAKGENRGSPAAGRSGGEPQAAAAKRVPVITMDRKINATACKDYVAFLGSNFVQQGQRAADALVKSTGGTGKVAILLASSGNNVTTDQTNGFVDQLKAKSP